MLFISMFFLILNIYSNNNYPYLSGENFLKKEFIQLNFEVENYLTSDFLYTLHLQIKKFNKIIDQYIELKKMNHIQGKTQEDFLKVTIDFSYFSKDSKMSHKKFNINNSKKLELRKQLTYDYIIDPNFDAHFEWKVKMNFIKDLLNIVIFELTSIPYFVFNQYFMTIQNNFLCIKEINEIYQNLLQYNINVLYEQEKARKTAYHGNGLIEENFKTWMNDFLNYLSNYSQEINFEADFSKIKIPRRDQEDGYSYLFNLYKSDIFDLGDYSFSLTSSIENQIPSSLQEHSITNPPSQTSFNSSESQRFID